VRAKDYDRRFRIANERGQSISSLVGELVNNVAPVWARRELRDEHQWPIRACRFSGRRVSKSVRHCLKDGSNHFARGGAVRTNLAPLTDRCAASAQREVRPHAWQRAGMNFVGLGDTRALATSDARCARDAHVRMRCECPHRAAGGVFVLDTHCRSAWAMSSCAWWRSESTRRSGEHASNEMNEHLVPADRHDDRAVYVRRASRVVVWALVLLLPPVPPVLASQRTPRQTVIRDIAQNATQAQVQGTVVAPDGRPLPRTTVRARNIDTGDIAGAPMTTMQGHFTITLGPGSYLLEIVDADGQIIGTSSLVSISNGTSVTVPTITATMGRSAGRVAALLGGTTTRAAIVSAAAAAGVAGVVMARDKSVASPSR
jgi:hypothetical protein